MILLFGMLLSGSLIEAVGDAAIRAEKAIARTVRTITYRRKLRAARKRPVIW